MDTLIILALVKKYVKQYKNLIKNTLKDGTYKPNRTGVDTISSFSQHYDIDLQNGFPLLTTKHMEGYRWNSLIHELLWYFSGEEHIKNLREETKIWDAWADDEGKLETAYGRFWRRYPIPDDGLPGEAWPDDTHRWVNDDEQTFDQLQYVIDQLQENPNSRRLVVNAWHPANAAVSKLPPCHYSFVFNVQGDRLNTHLTQRSGDIGLGIPFNIAAYALITHIVAQQTGFVPGTFSHTIVDSHIYCGKGERGEWYRDNLREVKGQFKRALKKEDYTGISGWIESEAPADDGYDHLPGLIRQTTRAPKDRPEIQIADKPLDELMADDIQLHEYDAHPGISFKVAK